MPFNGSGTFSRLYSWVTDAANSVNISSSRTDAEMNGFAAGLTNCITRDGQSPPSADIPWGAKKLTNLGAATVGTDALNRDTADARYILTSAAAVALAGSLSVTTSFSAASSAISGNITVGGSLGVTGPSTVTTLAASSNVTLSANNSRLIFTDLSGGNPFFIAKNDNTFGFYTTDATGAALQATSIQTHNNSPTFSFLINAAGLTPATADNSTLLATTAYVQANAVILNASIDALKDIPQNAQTAAYTLALTDRGKHISITTGGIIVPANALIAFGIGATIGLYNNSGSNQSISITTDTMFLAGTATTGTRTLAQHGFATLVKVAATTWVITGAGLT